MKCQRMSIFGVIGHRSLCVACVRMYPVLPYLLHSIVASGLLFPVAVINLAFVSGLYKGINSFICFDGWHC